MICARLLPRVRRRLGPNAVFEAVQALLAHPAPSGFEPVAEEVESFPLLPAVTDVRFVRVQSKPFSATQAAISAKAASASSRLRHNTTSRVAEGNLTPPPSQNRT